MGKGRESPCFLLQSWKSFLFTAATLILLSQGGKSELPSRKLSWDEFQKIFRPKLEISSASAQDFHEKRGSRQEDEITLISFLQNAVKSYGEKKVATTMYELAQHSMYDLVWLLAGDIDPFFIYDLYKMYNAGISDPGAVRVYELFQAGMVNRSIVPEVFRLDKKYDGMAWYRRVRTRMLYNVDKYMAGSLALDKPPPKIEFGPDGRPIIEGKPENVVEAQIQFQSTTVKSKVNKVSTKKPTVTETDEDTEDFDLDDVLENIF